MAQSFGLSEYEVSLTHVASLMHDVGKIVMLDDALKSSGKLDAIGRAMVESHSRDGANILNKIGEFRELAKVVLYHHERYDGHGYPVGLAGEEIPFISRILCVADSYSAMVSDRPYRSRLSTEVAISELVKNKGTQFDPAVVDCFLELLESHDDDYRRGENGRLPPGVPEGQVPPGARVASRGGERGGGSGRVGQDWGIRPSRTGGPDRAGTPGFPLRRANPNLLEISRSGLGGSCVFACSGGS